MTRNNVPTILDLALFLNALHSYHELLTGEEEHTARWLIDRVPESRELWQEMNTARGEAPSLYELATFVLAAGGPGIAHHGDRVARWLIQRVPAARESYEQLRRVERELGEDAPAASLVRWRLDRLVAVLDAGWRWSDPDDVLDVVGDAGFSYDPLLRLCKARRERAKGRQRELLDVVHQKLEKHLQRKPRKRVR